MLYDPKWEKKVETKANPFSLESLIAWLETCKPTQRYNFCLWQQCLLGQWLRSVDPAAYTPGPPRVESGFIYLVHGQHVDLRKFKEIASGGPLARPKDLTFGAALERARASLASTE